MQVDVIDPALPTHSTRARLALGSYPMLP